MTAAFVVLAVLFVAAIAVAILGFLTAADATRELRQLRLENKARIRDEATRRQRLGLPYNHEDP